MGKLLTIPLVLLALLLASLYWSGGGQMRHADFTFINRGDVITLDPNQMSYVQDFRISYATREGLCAYDAKTLEPKPAGASSIDVTPDKKIWTFHLRPEAKWTNGDPVRARDYIFAWRRMLEEPGDYTYLHFYIKNAQQYSLDFASNKPVNFDDVGVKALDELTLQVTLHDPVSFFLDLVAFTPFYPMHEASMEPFKTHNPNDPPGHFSYKPDFTRPPWVVTNGPYELKQWDFKRRLWLERSPTYWDHDNVKLSSIEMVVNEDRLSQVLQYESGEVDWVSDLGSDTSAEMKEMHRPDLIVTPGFGTCYLCVNTGPDLPGGGGKNPLHDVRVRQAISMAIDKQQICDNITRMTEKPATTYTPPGIFAGFNVTPGFGFDVAKARQLLADAGYPGGKNCPTIDLMFSTSSPVLKDMMQNVKNQLEANLSIKITLTGLEQKIVRTHFHSKDYMLGPSTWIGDYGDPSTFTDKYLSGSLNNDSNWSRPDYDALCAKAASEPDTQKRLGYLEDAEKIIDSDLPVIPLYYLVNTDACRPYVHINFNPRMTITFKSIEVDKH